MDIILPGTLLFILCKEYWIYQAVVYDKWTLLWYSIPVVPFWRISGMQAAVLKAQLWFVLPHFDFFPLLQNVFMIWKYLVDCALTLHTLFTSAVLNRNICRSCLIGWLNFSVWTPQGLWPSYPVITRIILYTFHFITAQLLSCARGEW